MTTTGYVEFSPPRRPEEYVGQAGPHEGLALTHDVLDAIAESKVSGRPHRYLVRGEWQRNDGTRYLDFAIDRRWLEANSNYRTVEGMLRWTCPECGKTSGKHLKLCGYES